MGNVESELKVIWLFTVIAIVNFVNHSFMVTISKNIIIVSIHFLNAVFFGIPTFYSKFFSVNYRIKCISVDLPTI